MPKYFCSQLAQYWEGEKAIAILKSYQTPLNAFLNVDEWPKNVYGLGPKISSRVKEVLNTPFKG
ncbi:hypothetical protein KEJ32_05905 [Candidatus Bathyarchaeota archaeon]|nr:hypothetical protein [Candidatus Bathyarchaeota archaeon]